MEFCFCFQEVTFHNITFKLRLQKYKMFLLKKYFDNN